MNRVSLFYRKFWKPGLPQYANTLWSVVFICLLLTGCSSTKIPNYIHAENPYKHKFYASFENVLKATKQALSEEGWEVSKTADPAIYEMEKVMDDPNGQQVLIFTRMRPLPFVLGSKYSRLNVYLRTGMNESIDAEVRYVDITSVSFRNLTSYESDQMVERLLTRIEQKLNQ